MKKSFLCLFIYGTVVRWKNMLMFLITRVLLK